MNNYKTSDKYLSASPETFIGETNGRVQTARAFPDSINSWPDYYKSLPASYGLTGPVKLIPYGVSVIK